MQGAFRKLEAAGRSGYMRDNETPGVSRRPTTGDNKTNGKAVI